MSDYRIIYNMDADDIMEGLSESEEVEFMRDCYNYLGVYQQRDFIETLGAEEVVEHLGEEAIIEELERRGYKIPKDGII